MSRSYVRLIVHPVKSIRTALKVFRPHVWVLSGDEISSGQKLSIIYAGNETNRNFISHLAFSDSCRTEYIGKKWLWKIPKIIRQNSHNCSLAVVEVPGRLRVFSERTKCFYVPGWVNGEVDVSDNIMRDSLKTDIRRIRRNKLCFEVTHDQQQLYNFYHDMYVPYITKVHGSRSKIMDYNYVKRQFCKSGLYNDLLLIKKGEKYIAGILIGYRRHGPRLYSVGVKDGNLDYVEDGAMGALFYFPTVYFREKGYEKVNFGQSRSFLKDGVLQFKKRRGMQLVGTSTTGFLFKLCSETTGVRGFFLNNPFIYEDGADLKGTIFASSGQLSSKEDYARIYKDYHLKGLSKLVIYCFDEKETCSAVHPQFSDKIAVRSAASIF